MPWQDRPVPDRPPTAHGLGWPDSQTLTAVSGRGLGWPTPATQTAPPQQEQVEK